METSRIIRIYNFWKTDYRFVRQELKESEANAIEFANISLKNLVQLSVITSKEAEELSKEFAKAVKMGE